MRFSHLHLRRYGSFENHTLSFPHTGSDLHIIHGHNEAGKSTTKSAITDLLFGFPPRKTQDWQFDAATLRVGATLTHEGTALTAFRKRGKPGNTLCTEDDAALDETRLLTWLQGLTRETFLTSWCLDHTQLRAGGKAMVEMEDDFGQQLLAAGSGLTEIRHIRDTLNTEADTIHTPNRNVRSKPYNRARTALTEARQALKDATLKPQHWLQAQKHEAELAETLQALQQQATTLDAEYARLERTRRLLTRVHTWQTLTATFDPTAKPTLTPEDEARFAETERTLHTTQDTLDRLTREQDALRLQRDATPQDPAILAHAETLEALRDDRLSIRSARARLPEHEAALTQEQARHTTLLADLGLPPDHPLPRKPDIAHLQALTQTLHAATAQRRSAETARLAAIAQVEDARRALPTHTPTEPDALRLALRQTATHETLEADVTRLTHALVTTTRTAAAHLETLALPDEAALATTTPPPDDLTADYRTRWTQSEHTLQDATAAHARTDAEHARLVLIRDQHAQAIRIVTPQNLLTARQTRDALLTTLHASPTARTFEALATSIHHADTLADQRFDQAEAATQHLIASQQAEQAALALTHAAKTLDAARHTRHILEQNWRTLLETRALPPTLTPADIPDYRARHTAAQAALTERDRLKAERAIAETRLAEAHHWLQPHLPENAPPGLSARRTLLETRLARSEAETAQLREHTATIAAAETQKRTTDRTCEAARLHEAECRAIRQDAARALGLPPDDEARLTLIEDARHAATECERLAQTLASHTNAITRFDTTLTQTLAALNDTTPYPTPDAALTTLLDRLSTARHNATRHTALTERNTALQADIAAAGTTLETARRTLAPLLEKSGSPDQPALRARIAHHQNWRAAMAQRDSLAAEIVANGDGHPLETLLQDISTADPDALAARKQVLTAERTTLSARITAIATERGAAQKDLQTLRTRAEQETSALASAEAVETAKADLVTQAEAYILARAQALILHHAIEKRRQSAHHPLLNRAGALFRHLTLGRYDGFTLDEDNDTPILTGRTATDGRLVRISAMSDGTADQVYLSLRLAALEQSLDRGLHIPLIADDLFINFDEPRARAGLDILADFSRRTQTLFFTHHTHLHEPPATTRHRLP